MWFSFVFSVTWILSLLFSPLVLFFSAVVNTPVFFVGVVNTGAFTCGVFFF